MAVDATQHVSQARAPAPHTRTPSRPRARRACIAVGVPLSLSARGGRCGGAQVRVALHRMPKRFGGAVGPGEKAEVGAATLLGEWRRDFAEVHPKRGAMRAVWAEVGGKGLDDLWARMDAEARVRGGGPPGLACTVEPAAAHSTEGGRIALTAVAVPPLAQRPRAAEAEGDVGGGGAGAAEGAGEGERGGAAVLHDDVHIGQVKPRRVRRRWRQGAGGGGAVVLAAGDLGRRCW